MTDEESESIAILIENAVFHYKTNAIILDHLNLNVAKGEILALLGPTGAGKTTIIRAILDRISLNKGSVSVFGQSPGSPGIAIPGKDVGYMPQELALFEELTIEEILNYYGIIYHLKDIELKRRIEELIELLNLPEKKRPISCLSGGQQRRVSIAITIIHRPKLIILDEPTVGVDPVLRKTIWDHLKELSMESGQTILITTHYIEEARSANTVAFMNYGKILKQGDPDTLMQQYESSTLEQVFLILCQSNRKNSIPFADTLNAMQTTDQPRRAREVRRKSLKDYFNVDLDYYRIKALTIKYILTLVRQPMIFWIYMAFMPTTIISMRIFWSDRPNNIPIAVYNADWGSNLSHLFVDELDKRYLNVNEFSNNESAFESVVKGINHVSLVIPEDFSDSCEYRLAAPLRSTEEELEAITLRLSVDTSSVATFYCIQYELTVALRKFLAIAGKQVVGQDVSRQFDLLSVEQTLRGHYVPDFSLLLICGGVLMHLFFINLCLSSFKIITDKMNLSFERMFVAGVTPSEFFLVHIMTSTIGTILASLEIIIFAYYIFDFPLNGSPFLVFFLLFIFGVESTAIGIIIGTMAKGLFQMMNILYAVYAITGYVSGEFWPFESIPLYFRLISRSGPITNANLAYQAIAFKGLTITSPVVMTGLLTCTIYTVIALSISYLLLKLKIV